MTAYYNEIDPYAAQWLRNLIQERLIADGEVDTRSIVDVRPDELDGFTQCHFFAGLGGWSGALRLAGVSDTEPLWTGSCPCQPFSLAGKQKGFADDRHLWPAWRELIRQRRPAIVLGEQVASAAQWLRLVRGDLEALGYAVGAIPVEAASAGADHLRDRYWFVGHDTRQRRGEGQTEHAVHERDRTTAAGSSGVGQADANHSGPQGRQFLSERAGERIAGPDGVADSNQLGARQGREQRSGEFRWTGGDQETCDSGDVGDTASDEQRRQRQCGQGGGVQSAPRGSGSDYEWAIGADGKARRVKPGIRLLAHGVPARVAKLRALGNAIDLRPAAEFIGAAMTAVSSQNKGSEP
jgi:DNA (cytosine-5)-methyltransferase 1